MKPILLRLSGLQSYREAQEVDFERLCEAGVFGIFGPTGSGKSSILDAVTLALYGKVERAANGTQGIMNQAEKTLSVAFTFDLSGGGEHKRYRVERQFKRGGDVSVSNTLSRFVEVTDAGDIVIADKLADVTRCVEAQIGLNMQDFTRAVVLPQGKFAEFLSLTGKDRRSMLQRLFRLERFGDGLALKLGQRMKAAEAALQEAAAEQLGLGDASAAAVDAAAARHRDAAAAAASARASLAEAERLHAERLHVRERLTALREKEALQAQLLAEAPRVAELERELQRLAAAERLLPALAAADAAEATLRAAASRREAAGLAHAARLEAASAAAAAWTAAAAEAAAGEPRLALRLDQLAQARRLEGEAAELAASTAAGEARAREAEERERTHGEKAAKAQEMLVRAAAKQNELRGELKSVELTAADRDKRSHLTKRLQQHQQLLARSEAARLDREAAGGQQLKAKHALELAHLAQAQSLTALAMQAGQLEPVYDKLNALGDQLVRLGDAFPLWMERARREQLDQQRERLALQLAEDLAAGEPCPVCGSCVHPGRHAAVDGSMENDNRILTAWESLAAHSQQLRLQLLPLQSKAAAVMERLSESLKDEAKSYTFERASVDPAAPQDNLAGLREAAAASETVTPDGPQGLSPTSLSGTAIVFSQISAVGAVLSPLSEQDTANSSVSTVDALQLYEQALASAKEWGSVLGQQFAAIEKTAADARGQHADAQRKLEQCASAFATQEALTSSAQQRLDQASAELDKELKEWHAIFGSELQPHEGAAALESLNQRDEAADELRNRLERSVTYIEETTRAQQESSALAQEARLEAVELAATLTVRRQQLSEKQGLLVGITGGTPAAVLIEAAEQELVVLRAKTAALTQQHEAAQQALQQAAEQRTGAAEAERAADERQKEAASSWEEALSRSPFQRADEVAALQPMLVQQTSIAELIARHRDEAQQLAAQILLLRDQLAGRTITEEEWEAAVTSLQQRRAENELSLQAAAKAERDWEELRGKQERWNSLEAKRLEMEQLCGRLKSLQTVFRGNAFVEYVAEEQLVQVCRAASERLGFLTKRRYALEVDSGGGFVIRDDAGGGIRRPVSTLSGGETFLASLALALALSGQIQLRGKYPLQFFFLDEGFGTLDPELLDTVITALEKLQNDTLSVGVISHVPELRARLPRRLIVTPSEPFGKGSTVELETM
ncbi:AAA family ATPase [Paenibacillus sp. R14(2021)]|uniref:AAA family ATPase n=1 Tax=Paenibacillus sp. R14(2021) TaxID=2859228 RepID=UPI001C6113E8|nr:AAA family ATPase [Paenibacillus sp. R14(2021)]